MSGAARILACVFLVPTLAAAGELDQAVRSRWLGAWVLTRVETWSDCAGLATNNRVNGRFVQSRGDHRFQPGELAKVEKVDARKARVDLHLALAEPHLLPRPAGPFTLLDEAHCKVELEVMVDRAVLRGREMDVLDAALASTLERFPTEALARGSGSWNGRVPVWPEDYERTLLEHAIWHAETTNAAVQERLDLALEVTGRLTEAMSDDLDYVAGLSEGIQEARRRRLGGCPSLLSVSLEPERRRRADDEEDASEALRRRGRADGRRLVLGLELMRRLPACFVPVPERSAERADSGQVPPREPSRAAR